MPVTATKLGETTTTLLNPPTLILALPLMLGIDMLVLPLVIALGVVLTPVSNAPLPIK